MTKDKIAETTNTDKAVREVAEEMARRDRKQYPNAKTMPSIQHYEEKAREVMALVVPYIRPALKKAQPNVEGLVREIEARICGLYSAKDMYGQGKDKAFKEAIALIRKWAKGEL